MRPITVTIYMFANDDERPDKWDVAEWLGDPTVSAWEITEGHGACAACLFDKHDELQEN